MLEIVNARGNDNKCGECGAAYPTWASVNLGVFLCGRCALAHKKVLGPLISRVKLLTLDQWSTDEIERLRRGGNKRNKQKWNPQRVPFPFDADDDPRLVETFLVEKYDYKLYRDGAGPDSDDDHSPRGHRLRSRLNSHFSGTRLRTNLRATNREVPRLSHRKLTTYENTQYQSQVRTIQGFGYQNRDAILELLLLANGVVDDALEILQQDLKVNPNQDEIAPALPRRRPGMAGQATGALPAPSAQSAPQGSDEWWNTAGTPPVALTPTGLPGMVSGQPQIYQYTDPVTGQVSYIDSNGQQYLDPLNPQHQQQLMQQTPQFLQQQATKQNIMSMYSQPTGAQQPQFAAGLANNATGQPTMA